jgi:hypothetical protein
MAVVEVAPLILVVLDQVGQLVAQVVAELVVAVSLQRVAQDFTELLHWAVVVVQVAAQVLVLT